mmetsp:Transcript_28628/g.36978  ORF Transcript_28628/g.36978 Transcript_28628/m.36978 type:complete len:1104 (-) Transcript_28628:347-3658(-)
MLSNHQHSSWIKITNMLRRKGYGSGLNSFIEKCMQHIAIKVDRFPFSVVLVTFGFTILCSFGLRNLEIDSGYGLFVPNQSQHFKNAKTMMDLFPLGPAPHLNQILVTTEEGQENLLDKETLDLIWELDHQIRSAQTPEQSVYIDICQKVWWKELDRLDCEVMGGLKYWAGDWEIYKSTVSSNADILAAVNSQQYLDGSPVWNTVNLGGIERNKQGYITGAQAMLLQYPTYVQYEFYETEFQGMQIINNATASWERMFWQLPIFENNVYNGLRIYHTNRIAERDSREDSKRDLLVLVVVSVILMFTLASFFVSKLKHPGMGSKCWGGHGVVGFLGVLSSLMSTAAGFGICAYFGLQCSLLNLTLPCVLLGIGVDDMFLIVSHFEATDPELDRRSRIVLGLKEVGASILFTTLSDMAAFGLGALSDLVAVQNFGIYAAVCVLLDFLYQITFFVSVLLIISQIEDEGFKVFLKKKCCLKKSPPVKSHDESSEKEAPSGKSAKHSEGKEDDSASTIYGFNQQSPSQGDPAELKAQESKVQQKISKRVAPQPQQRVGTQDQNGSKSSNLSPVIHLGLSRGSSIESCSALSNNAMEADLPKRNGEEPTGVKEEGIDQNDGWIHSTYRRAIEIMLSRSGKICVSCLCIAYWIFISVAASRIDEYFDHTVFLPSNSLGDIFTRKTDQFDLRPSRHTFEVNLIFDQVNFTDIQVQHQILELEDAVLKHPSFGGPFDSLATELNKKATELSDWTGVEFNDIFHPHVLAFSLLDRKFTRFFDDISGYFINGTHLFSFNGNALYSQFEAFDIIPDEFTSNVEDEINSCQKELYIALIAAGCNEVEIESNEACAQIYDAVEDVPCGNLQNTTINDGNATIPSLIVEHMRTQFIFKDLPLTVDKRHALKDLNTIISTNFDPESKPYAVDNMNEFVFLDILHGLFLSMFASFYYGLACVAMLVVLFFGSIRTALVTCIFLIIVDIAVYAIPYIIGVPANVPSYLMVMVSFGIVVDYFVHVMAAVERVAEEFPNCAFSKVVKMALKKVGLPMVLLSITSILSAAPLLFAVTKLGRQFGQIYILIVLNGLFHGLIALPVTLSLFDSIYHWCKKGKVLCAG